MIVHVGQARSRNWVYLVAAMLLLFLAAWVWGDGATFLAWVPYAALAMLCVFQFFRPLAVLWWLIFAVFAAGSLWYGWVFLRDLWYLATGGHTQVLLDGSDSIAFVIYLVAVSAIAIRLLRLKPKATRGNAT